MFGAVAIGAAHGRISTGPTVLQIMPRIHRGAVGELVAGILRIVGDNVVLFEVTQKLIVGNGRLGQDPEVHAGAIGVGRIAVVFIELRDRAAVGGEEPGP